MLSYNFANFVCRLHVASCKFLSETKVLYSLMNLRFLVLLTKEGIIEGFRVFNEFIIVFLKRNIFNYSFLFKFSKLISTPGKRQYWNLVKLYKNFSYKNFSGFFVISTNKGLLTSTDALLKYRTAGEILLKLKI